LPDRRKQDQHDWLIRLVLGWGANLLALWLAARWIDSVGYKEFADLAIAAAVLAAVNLVVKPILTALGCLVIIVTLGVALFFVNMAMVALTAWLVPGFHVGGFWSVAGTTVIVWAANVLVQAPARRARKKSKTLPYP
jgi:putative membrane protein